MVNMAGGVSEKFEQSLGSARHEGGKECRPTVAIFRKDD
jgi:hypothetical protein